MNAEHGNVTHFLQRVRAGDRAAAEELLPIIYEELRRIAARQFRHENPGHTLQPTAIVHEAYVKLLAGNGAGPQIGDNRAHFFAIASRAIRQVLVSHARARNAEKRGGDKQRVPLDAAIGERDAERQVFDTVALHEAIDELATLDPRHAQIAELRLFGGLSLADVSEVIPGSLRKIQLEWKTIRHWLTNRLRANDE